MLANGLVVGIWKVTCSSAFSTLSREGARSSIMGSILIIKFGRVDCRVGEPTPPFLKVFQARPLLSSPTYISVSNISRVPHTANPGIKIIKWIF